MVFYKKWQSLSLIGGGGVTIYEHMVLEGIHLAYGASIQNH